MANRYWVGGTDIWNGTAGTKWSTTSGGAGGAGVPGSSDDVFFDAASGAVTCTISSSRVCLSLNCTGFTGTLAGTSTPILTISGSMTLATGMTLGTVAFTFNSSTAGRTITSAGKSISNALTFNGNGSWVLQDALTQINGGSNSGTTLTSGTLDLNNYTATFFFFNSNNNSTRAISFGTGSIVLAGTASVSFTTWNVETATNLTITGTPNLSLVIAGTGTMSVNNGSTAGGTAARAINIASVTLASVQNFAFSGHFNDVDLTGLASTNSVSNTARTIYGNIAFDADATLTAGIAITTFAATAGTQTLTTNGRTLDFPITHSGAGTLQLTGDTVIGSAAARVISHTAGTFDLNGYTLSGRYDLRSNAILSAAGATLTTSGTGANIDLNSTGSATLTGTTISTVNFSSAIPFDLAVPASFTCTGAYTLSANTLTLSNSTLTVGSFLSNNTNVRSIAFGTGKIQVTGTGTCWSCATVTNFSETGSGLVELTTNTATLRSIQHGNSAGGTEARALNFTITAGTGSVSATSSHINDFIFQSGFSGAADLPGFLYGNLELSVNQTIGNAACSFAATSGVKTIITNGRTFTGTLTFNGVGGSWQLQGALASTTTLTFTNGTFDGNSYSVTATTVALGAGTKTLNMGGGNWTLSGTGTVWGMATNAAGLTFINNGSSITLSNTSTTARTFAGGDLTYGDLIIGGITGTSTLTISGSNTFANVASIKTANSHTISLTSGTTQTVANWTAEGNSGNAITINATSVGTQATLNKTGGGQLTLDWLVLADNNATPASTWNAGANTYSAIGNGTPNVTGWYSLLIGVVLTTGTSWTSPTNWESTANNIYLLGGGGGGAGGGRSTNTAAGGGGGAGAYTQIQNLPLANSTAYTYAIGAAGASGAAGATSTGGTGGNTTFNDGTNTYTANGGTGGSQVAVTPASTGGVGGTASTVTGLVVASFAGGDGAAGNTAAGTATSTGGGGGGGAGGPNGVGGAGGASTGISGGGGGGSGGGSAGGTGTATFGVGGNNFSGAGGGTTVGASGTLGGGGAGGQSTTDGGVGGRGLDVVQFAQNYGSGGGAGGGAQVTNTAAVGGFYGGGGGGGGTSTTNQFAGGAGRVGLIVITYITPSSGAAFLSDIAESATAADSVSAFVIFLVDIAEAAAGADAVAAGFSVNSSVAETATALDSLSGSLQAFSSVAESATGSDSVSGVANLLSSVSETVTALDQASSVPTYSTAVSETATTADAASAKAALSANTSETATALDAVAAGSSVGASVSDTAAAQDAPRSNLQALSSVAESTTGSDTVSGAAGFLSSVSETSTVLDAVSASPQYTAAIAESVTAADEVVSSFAFESVIQEFVQASDNIIGSLVYFGSTNETATISDSASAKLLLSAAIQESVTGSDSVRGSAAFLAFFSDTVFVLDVVAGRRLWELIDDDQTPNWTDINDAAPGLWQAISNTQTPGWTNVTQDTTIVFVQVNNDQDPQWVQINNT